VLPFGIGRFEVLSPRLLHANTQPLAEDEIQELSWNLLEHYILRQLSYESDALNAFSGVMSVLVRADK
jgi:hypothetical protein